MRAPFVHEAVLRIASGADTRAPGAAITVALCGHWEHEPPCPLAPHHTSATKIGAELHLRTLFVVEPAREDHVRGLIDTALAEAQILGPGGEATSWQLRSSGAGSVLPEEADHAKRLAAS